MEKIELKNQPCYDANGNFLGWFSRSVAVVVFIFRRKNNKWQVLTEIRGTGAADFQGKRCCVCGYCEFNNTLNETCLLETFQETGMEIDEKKLIMVDINSNPSNNKQNISIHYVYVVQNNENINFDNRTGGEENEVEKVEWVDIDKLPTDFCFNHDTLIKKYVYRLRKNNFFHRLTGSFLRKQYIYY